MSILTIQKKDGKMKVQPNRAKQQASRTVQELLDINGIEDNVITNTNYCKYYIKIAPKNINILTNDFLLNEILNLKTVLNIINSIEILVVDKVERLEDNKNYIVDLINESTEEVTRMLLERDLESLKQLESEKGSSREFYIVVPFKNEDVQTKQVVINIQQVLEERGFTVLSCDKQVLKNMLQVYLERNFTGEVIQDFDI
ncbi:hypothetical protein [Clostridium estertheticum]|uniref:hypothetical protein n=1 Tax=Clostridium estertheticum TaxID=238834 RepID=UPI001CF1E32D|nr:hypothetical protein [Clostridium estertheticum]MCB2357103.1 hypothetical protein [Clostridium estertheticum]WAG44046.1 hypothetical protein LL065_26125 [Clostridium estertheticum]